MAQKNKSDLHFLSGIIIGQENIISKNVWCDIGASYTRARIQINADSKWTPKSRLHSQI